MSGGAQIAGEQAIGEAFGRRCLSRYADRDERAHSGPCSRYEALRPYARAREPPQRSGNSHAPQRPRSAAGSRKLRMVSDPRTRDVSARRTNESRSKREIIRSLKRYVARELYRCLPRPQPA